MNPRGHARLCYARVLCNQASPRVYEGSDPNGIRTRVTAVKGRCPGPLDDRVTKARAISELLLLDARQIAELFSNFGT